MTIETESRRDLYRALTTLLQAIVLLLVLLAPAIVVAAYRGAFG